MGGLVVKVHPWIVTLALGMIAMPVDGQEIALVSTPLLPIYNSEIGLPFLSAARIRDLANPCTSPEVVANPTRPNWDNSTTTTQCGVLEGDFGWIDQPMRAGVRQQQVVTSLRYGVTPKLDVRIGMTNWIGQFGSETETQNGAGDQCYSVRYRFAEQSQMFVSLAVLYGYKLATASPAKGLGSGFGDHTLTLLASRDQGKYHLDFNVAGTIAGTEDGHEGAAQYGLALSRPLTKKLAMVLESYGGPQPGTTDRFGANLVGASYVLNPRVVLDVAYARTYTAGSPRSQLMAGITVAHRVARPALPGWMHRKGL